MSPKTLDRVSSAAVPLRVALALIGALWVAMAWATGRPIAHLWLDGAMPAAFLTVGVGKLWVAWRPWDLHVGTAVGAFAPVVALVRAVLVLLNEWHVEHHLDGAILPALVWTIVAMLSWLMWAHLLVPFSTLEARRRHCGERQG